MSSTVNDYNEKSSILDPTKLARTSVSLLVRCGDCFHFKHQKATAFSDVCSRLGILEAARPCPHFLVNAKTFSVTTAQGATMAEVISKLPNNKLRMYAALMSQEHRTRRLGFKHGELVYVHVFPGEYESNYARAWIIMASRQQIFVQGKSSNFRGVLMPMTVFKADAFARKRTGLRSRGKLIDPELKKYTGWKPPNVEHKAELPTIDELTEGSPLPKIKVTRRTPLDQIIKIRG
jgi:hypothetical protein